MAKTAKIEVKDQNPAASLRSLFETMFEKGEISALLSAQHLPMKDAVMPALVTDPERLEGMDPLAPAFPINAAKVLGKLTRKPFEGTVAAVLRPCEVRAFVELVKLNQGSLDNIVLVGFDCLGAYSNVDYPRFVGENGREATLKFLREALDGRPASEGLDIAPACRACEHPVADAADLNIGLLGMDVDKEMLLKANTQKGEEFLERLGLPGGDEPESRKDAVDALAGERAAFRDEMFARTEEATSDVAKLGEYLAGCVNCYNCRVACPVCFCKECVFVTDVFDHEPMQYLKWARQKGVIKMPTDTVFFHLTRLVHMSTACVGCGQCSNACPNNVPVMELFRTLSRHTQKAFDYEAGRSVDEPPPLSVFHEAEFRELTGGKD